MNPADRGFKPPELTVSKFRAYSLGVVAENKALGTNVIEVTPIEDFTMLDGELSAAQTNTTSSGTTSSGEAYNTSVKTGNTIQATWIKTGEGNRITSPDVRRGAVVMIYQFGDSDKFYWTTHKDDMNLRRLETVMFGFTGTKVEGAANTAENMYYLEISTHTGLVTFHTSKANGEFCGYDIQINAKSGNIQIQDDIGNYFLLDSAAHRINMQNTDGSYIDMNKQILSMFTKDTINIQTQNLNLKATTTNLSGTTFKVQETTTTINSSTISTSGTSVTVEGTAEFEGASFVVQSPIIDLG